MLGKTAILRLSPKGRQDSNSKTQAKGKARLSRSKDEKQKFWVVRLGAEMWQKGRLKGTLVCFLAVSIPLWSFCHYFPVKYLNMHTFMSTLFFFFFTLCTEYFWKHKDTMQSILKETYGIIVTISIFSISQTECYSDTSLFKSLAQSTMQEPKPTTIFRTQTCIYGPILLSIFFIKLMHTQRKIHKAIKSLFI